LALLRKGTFDAAICASIEHEYPTLPASFAPGEIVLDLGCHTGAVCQLAAEREATVVGYEASRKNYSLAVTNLHNVPSITLHHAAVRRSDVASTRLLFTPSADGGNTGGGSVVFCHSRRSLGRATDGGRRAGAAGHGAIEPRGRHRRTRRRPGRIGLRALPQV
jgi:SAM-dependent methyltransferase